MLEIRDYHELLALNRALMEVRYLANDVDDATRGSSFLSQIHERTIEAIKMCLLDAKKGSEAAAWDDWARLDGRKNEILRIIEYLTPLWPRLTSAVQKRKVLVNQLRPFSFRNEDIDQLIVELDNRAAL